MIVMRRAQRSFGDGLIAAEVGDLREDWMEHADAVLADEALVAAVYEALGKRHPKSKSRGRQGTPAEVVLRLLILKHIRNWSYDVLEREVRANLVYRMFTRIDADDQLHRPRASGIGRRGIWRDRTGRRFHLYVRSKRPGAGPEHLEKQRSRSSRGRRSHDVAV